MQSPAGIACSKVQFPIHEVADDEGLGTDIEGLDAKGDAVTGPFANLLEAQSPR
jgi:hypothetical protein